mmetsp:Transcript_30542/g.50431  ORF Transcript_30542/g.50431 Transcript_30542/m.50431 type:complete len:637 (-) Transcript_30542:179-2089(-)
MVAKVHSLPSQDSKHFDFIVVGGGSAGAVIASRLAEYNPNGSIALLEAGNRATEMEAKMPVACGKMQRTKRDWGYLTEPEENSLRAAKDQRVACPRGKCLGGSSVLNYMAYVRGAQEDFDTWEREHGATGWNWKKVLPLFLKSENNETLRLKTEVDGLSLEHKFHNTNGLLAVSSNPTPGKIPQAFVRGAVESGFEEKDYNCGSMENTTSVFQQTIKGGRRADTATCFLDRTDRDVSNLTIVTDAHATRLLFNNDKSKVVGVECVDLAARGEKTVHKIHAKNEVIVSCGAFGSPHLLLLSGIGKADELRACGVDVVVDSPHVGKNLEDHMFVGLFCEPAQKDIGATNAQRAEGMPGALPGILNWIINGKGLHATSAYDATAFYTTKSYKQSHPNYGPDAQIGVLSSPGDDGLYEDNARLTREANFYREHYNVDDAQGFILLPTLLHMYSKGVVELKSTDPLEHPKITANYLTDQRDVDRLVDIVKKAYNMTKSPSLAEICSKVALPQDMLAKHGGTPTDAFWAEYVRSYANTIYHPCSTCAIGKVVDATLKVKGVDGLRIADASVFPTITSGNTNAPSVMVGEKCAEMIAEEYHWDMTMAPKKRTGASRWNMTLLAGLAVLGASVAALYQRRHITP